MDAATVVGTYKSLALVERDFRSIKSIDLDLRPINHWTADRVRAHVFICMLAAYLVFHLPKAWAPLTFTDEDRPDPVDPVVPAKRSAAAGQKASTRTTTTGAPAYSFTGLLNYLATLTRNDIRYGTDPHTDHSHTHDPDHHPTPGIRTHPLPHPDAIEVDRTTTPKTPEIPVNTGISHVTTVVTSD